MIRERARRFARKRKKERRGKPQTGVPDKDVRMRTLLRAKSSADRSVGSNPESNVAQA